MLKSFKESFNNLVVDRVSEVGNEILNKNNKYQDANEQANELFHKIRKQLPEEFQNLMFDLESLYTAQMTVAQDVMYEQGLKDGIEMKNFLKLVI